VTLVNKNLTSKIPKEVSHVTDTLEGAGFEAYLVGGCVRDLLMGRNPKDWDVTTNAKPEEIIALFDKTVYENDFGTVGVYISIDVPYETPEADISRETFQMDVNHETPATPAASEKIEYFSVEVTPYRTEMGYTDSRHPDKVEFGTKLEDDLKRRDFTVNALAYRDGSIKDMYDGIKDIKDKVLRTVGVSDERFGEDALRMIRTVRFSCQLDFSVSHETGKSILKNAYLVKKISVERIRDEFIKTIMSPSPASGIVLLQKFGLLEHIIPELLEGVGCIQGGAHIYDVWEHLLHALQHAADKDWPLEIRLSALFHDIGKPRSRRDALGAAKSSAREAPKKQYTFYGHEVVGARMTKKIMERLKFSKREVELVEKFVRNHMFFSDTELITLSAVRRIIVKVSKEHIWDLMKVRECDRVGMKKKEAPYRLRKYFAMIEEALRDPISAKQLKINGEYMIKNLGIKPGPRMGWILSALLEEVLDGPEKNTIEQLSELVKSLGKLNDSELKTIGQKGKEKKEELEEREVSKLHSKHGVRKNS
jgi:tRNA nucleotidyltransferase (CCA-adding enzyme)